MTEFKAGDIIMTQEVKRVKLGNVTLSKLNKDFCCEEKLYGVPNGFLQDAKTVLEACYKETGKSTKRLIEAIGSSEFQSECGQYDLNACFYVAANVPMAWKITSVRRGGKNEPIYDLEAIALNRDMRKRDWERYLRLFGTDIVPPLREYLSVKSVDELFFAKKIVRLFEEGEKVL